MSKEVELKREARQKVSGQRRMMMSVRMRLIKDTLLEQKEGKGVKRRRSVSLPTEVDRTICRQMEAVVSPIPTEELAPTEENPIQQEPLLPPKLRRKENTVEMP